MQGDIMSHHPLSLSLSFIILRIPWYKITECCFEIVLFSEDALQFWIGNWWTLNQATKPSLTKIIRLTRFMRSHFSTWSIEHFTMHFYCCIYIDKRNVYVKIPFHVDVNMIRYKFIPIYITLFQCIYLYFETLFFLNSKH